MASLTGIKVIVAGGGLAGLTAAHALSARGAAIHLFEARERLGGRVHTLRQPFAPAHVEAGGEFIDGAHTEIRQLASSLGLTLTRVLKHGFGLVRQSDRDKVRVLNSQATAWTKLSRTLKPLAEAFEAAEGSWDSAAAAAIAPHSVIDALRAARAPAEVLATARAMRGLYAMDPEALSALIVVEQIVGNGSPSRSAMFRLAGGNDRLTEGLASRVRGTIAPGQIVRRISDVGDGVRVSVESRGRVFQIDGDYAVVALPAPLVRTCGFEPALREDQARALDTLGVGPGTKAFLQFGSRWWRRWRRPRAFASDLPIGAVWEAAEEQPDSAILTLFAGGSASATLRALLAKEGPSGVAHYLRWLGRPDAVSAFAPAVTWEDDPWARGAYAVFRPGFDPRLRRTLAHSHGRILFAGEHTSLRWQGFMNGAVESGLRVAGEVEQQAQVHRFLRQ